MKKIVLLALLPLFYFSGYSQFSISASPDFAIPLSKMKQLVINGVGINFRGAYSLNKTLSLGIGYNFQRFKSNAFTHYNIQCLNINSRYSFNFGLYGEFETGFCNQKAPSEFMAPTINRNNFYISPAIGYFTSLNEAKNICFDLGLGYNLIFAKKSGDNLSYINIKAGLIFKLDTKKK